MSIFHTRGPLPPESSLFRGRQTDLDKLTRWCSGEVRHYVMILGARQSGKTSLLLRLGQRLSTSQAVCHMDFEYLSDAAPTRVFEALGQELARTLGGPPASGRAVSDALSFSAYLCDLLEAHPAQRVLLLIEELGALPKSSRFALANALRAIFIDRLKPARRALARLMVVVAGNTELYDLAFTEVSPFANICETHYLSDLNEADALALVAGGLAELKIPADAASSLAAGVYRRVRGYPYLTQRLAALLEAVHDDGQSLDDDLLERNAEDLLSCDDVLFKHVRQALLEQDLMDAARSALDGKPRFSRHEEALARLELIGLLAPDDGHWQARNPLFARAVQIWSGDVGRNRLPALHAGLVRIFNGRGIPVGAGFLLRDRRALTCAHVVAAALGLRNGDPLPPEAELTLDFPLLPKHAPIRARVARIESYQDGKVDDIAVLELLAIPPDAALPLTFARAAPQWDGAFRVCGFPAGREDGAWADGLVREQVSDGRFQIVGATPTGYAIQPGFSGSPVWDEAAKGVLGMVVAADTDRDVKAAFMIPARELEKIVAI